MSLLEDIQTAAVDERSDLGTILRKCKLLAARLGSQPLESWLIYESNGYPPEVQVPDYRVWCLNLKGHFFGSFGSAVQNAPIPLMCLPENIRNNYKNYECRQSIASLEAMLKKDDGGGTFQLGTGDLAVILGTKVYEGQNCVQAWAEVGPGTIIELLNVVRNRILDFTLAIWKSERQAGELNQNPEHQIAPAKIEQIFNTTIYGGSANLVGTATESSIVYNIVNNDFSSLERALLDKGVLTEDIIELKAAVNSDPQPVSKNAFGTKVSQWIAKMVQKAADGSWDVGVGAAGGLLAQAIAKYYGF
ncbi:MAG: hypothetical protein H6750_11115 [Nitrospiraceae bacterium]|nr:hypothetical protein [Nitrospiraceae bacterium]MDR4485716.1 hypothetical protein [Nitrospirales bacterium]